MNFNIDKKDVHEIERQDITDLEQHMLVDGELQIKSYKDWKQFTNEQRQYFCVKNGFYIIPTTELIDFLKEEIGEHSDQAMEIGAGHGAISRELEIRAVDNFMQEAKEIKRLYQGMRQTTVSYGKHVKQMDGNKAVEFYSPKVVIGAYCTHKYNEKEHWRGGNVYGFNEQKILRNVRKYIHIGNRQVHSKKVILKQEHREIEADWILSRSIHVDDNVIWIWEK